MASLIFVNDKEAHVSFFIFLSLYRMIDAKNYQKIILTNILLGILIEFCQMPLPGRSFDMNDVVADAIGTLFGYFFKVGFDRMPLAFLNIELPNLNFAFLEYRRK